MESTRQKVYFKQFLPFLLPALIQDDQSVGRIVLEQLHGAADVVLELLEIVYVGGKLGDDRVQRGHVAVDLEYFVGLVRHNLAESAKLAFKMLST